MRILFLTSRFPYPPHRGDKLKILNLIRQLSKRHAVSLLSFVRDEREAQLMTEVKPLCERIEVVPHPLRRSLWNCVKNIGGDDPYQVAYFASGEMRRCVAEFVQSARPDILHTHLIRMAPYTKMLSGIPRVLDLTDAVSLYLKRFRDAHSSPVARALLGIELRRMVRFESILGDFNRVLVCSDVDRQVLLNHVPGAAIEILRNGIDLETFSTNGGFQREQHRIIFTGNMSYYPNADAARYLVKEILPLIRRTSPKATVYLVGQNPPRRVCALASSSVIVTGFVPDIRAEYLKSSVAVSPVRFGAGTLNKVLEPLALGIPVVATPMSVEGLTERHGGIVVAGTTEEFARAVSKVIEEGHGVEDAKKGAAEIRARYSWEQIAKSLERIYTEVVKEARAS